jgi:dephospho-CoA kinase
MVRLVIGLTGQRYSGKSEASIALSKKGFQILDFTADVLAPELKRQGKAVTRQNLIALATSLRKKYGTDILSRRLLKKAKGQLIAISGIRFPEEVACFKKAFGPAFKLIAITAPAKIRWARAAKMEKGEGKLSFKDFLAVEKAVTELNIPKLIKIADFRISNKSTKAIFYKKIDKIIKKL